MKHKNKTDFNLFENVHILGRSGYIDTHDLRIAFLNGYENKKYLSEDEKFNFTGNYFSREDVDLFLNKKDELKVDILLLNCLPGVIYDELIK
jgi:hypothetical protein